MRFPNKTFDATADLKKKNGLLLRPSAPQAASLRVRQDKAEATKYGDLMGEKALAILAK